MINKLWTDVSLENYNNWYSLTGKITETPQQYIQTWPNVNDWFKTFAIRAQNDINAYLNFILSKFPFDSFKDELVKETLRDMVYVCIEHWVFNRTPIEFNIDATIQFNNGNQFSANSIPTINVWDLAPSRMKIWARLTQLKQVFLDYNEDELDIEKIDLKAFYTKNEVDELINEQKAFTLSKQMKLYDDLIDDNENEIYRGPVTNFINKGYVATDYDKETETMILDWPDEIGTLSPEALQNNPQIGDFTHAATCDFSAKQQKRITTNENNIKLIENKVDINKQNIDDIKNNWFNIETSPLWKKVKNENVGLGWWYVIDWAYIYGDNTHGYNSINKLTKTNVRSAGNIEQNHIVIENINVDIDKITLWYDFNLKKFTVSNSTLKYETTIYNVYQYQGAETPTEFIAEDNNDNDYYTKLETDNLLIKKQNITDDDLQTIAKQIVPAINENKTNIDKKQDKLNANVWINIDDNNNINIDEEGYANKIFTYNNYNSVKKLETNNKTIIGAINENKTNIDNKVDKEQFSYAFAINTIGTEIPNLETTDKTVVGAINEIKDLIKKLVVWKTVGERIDDRNWSNFTPSLNAIYRVFLITETSVPLQNGYKEVIFFTPAYAIGTGTYHITSRKIGNSDATLDIKAEYIDGKNKWTLLLNGGDTGGAIYKLEELKAEDLYEIKSATLDVKSPEFINMEKPIKINSDTLLTNEIKENEWEINLKEYPTPNPYPFPKWKEVGAKININHIKYDFKPYAKYKIYYNFESQIISKKFSFISKEFLYGELNKDIQSLDWVKVNDRVVVSLQIQGNVIYIVGSGKMGQLLKLEELQD